MVLVAVPLTDDFHTTDLISGLFITENVSNFFKFCLLLLGLVMGNKSCASS